MKSPERSPGRLLGEALKQISKVVSYAAVIPLFLVMVIAVLDVVGGKIFGKSIQSTMEMIQYMNVPLVCLAMGYVEYQNGHTRIRVLVKHYPPVVQKVLFILGSLIGFVVCVYVSWSAVSLMSDYFQRQTPIQATSPVPVWPFVLCLIVGYGLTGISFLWSGVRALKQPFDGREEPPKDREEPLIETNLME